MALLENIGNSPIIKEGKVTIAIDAKTIVELCIGIFLALALSFLFLHLLKTNKQ